MYNNEGGFYYKWGEICLLDLGKDLRVAEEDQLLVVDLDGAAAVGRQQDLVALLELGSNDLSLLENQKKKSTDQFKYPSEHLALAVCGALSMSYSLPG